MGVTEVRIAPLFTEAVFRKKNEETEGWRLGFQNFPFVNETNAKGFRVEQLKGQTLTKVFYRLFISPHFPGGLSRLCGSCPFAILDFYYIFKADAECAAVLRVLLWTPWRASEIHNEEAFPSPVYLTSRRRYSSVVQSRHENAHARTTR